MKKPIIFILSILALFSCQEEIEPTLPINSATPVPRIYVIHPEK